MLWAGNVEIHEQASDWYAHHHEIDAAYNNVILHVVTNINMEVCTADGKTLPQLQLTVPSDLKAHYQELLNEETYPPCYRIIPNISQLTVHAWMSRLTVERLEEKTQRVQGYLQQTGGDWEHAFFMTLARNFGFGTNAQAFEQWAATINPQHIGKHRDDVFQVEAFFMGQAGLLNDNLVKPERRDSYYMRLKSEYAFCNTSLVCNLLMRWCGSLADCVRKTSRMCVFRNWHVFTQNIVPTFRICSKLNPSKSCIGCSE